MTQYTCKLPFLMCRACSSNLWNVIKNIVDEPNNFTSNKGKPIKQSCIATQDLQARSGRLLYLQLGGFSSDRNKSKLVTKTIQATLNI